MTVLVPDVVSVWYNIKIDHHCPPPPPPAAFADVCAHPPPPPAPPDKRFVIDVSTKRFIKNTFFVLTLEAPSVPQAQPAPPDPAQPAPPLPVCIRLLVMFVPAVPAKVPVGHPGFAAAAPFHHIDVIVPSTAIL